MTDQPAPTRPPNTSAPAGLRWAPAPEPATLWRIPTTPKRCRMVGANRRRCEADAVAETNRSPDRRGSNWWAYCAAHAYGRWIDDGQVMGWRLTPGYQLDRP